MPSHYTQMDNLLTTFLRMERFIRKGSSDWFSYFFRNSSGAEKLDSVTNDLWDLLQMTERFTRKGSSDWFSYFFRNGSADEKLDSVTNDLWDLLQMQRSIWKESHVLNALPAKLTEVGNIMSSGGTGKQHLKSSIRDLAWLEEHGQCLDNIRDGISTNPDAGRGAFANRFIPKGSLVGPAPLIHVPDKAMLKMYAEKNSPDDGERVVPDLDGPTTDQLILNYCFSHEDSTLLLCPYGVLTSLINHSSHEANARIVWSKVCRVSWQRDLLEAWLGFGNPSNRIGSSSSSCKSDAFHR
jgi:hypothetical protein